MFDNDKFQVEKYYKYETEELLLEGSRNDRRYFKKAK